MESTRTKGIVFGVVLLAIGAHSALAQRTDTVIVGSRRVEVVRMGRGAPTLVLESGAGESSTVWSGIIADLAKLTHVVAYSRAGHGGSTPTVSPGSPAASAAELNALLRTLGETRPVVLAGHSWGGLLTRLYTSMYPGGVAGLAIIDGTHEAQYARWAPLNPAFRFPDSIRATGRQVPPSARGDYDQLLRMADSQRIAGMKPLPSTLPLAVITALKPCAPKREFTCRDPRALDVWRELHDEWFAHSTNGLRIVSAGTGHNVMKDQPQLVLQAVRFVLEQARTSRR